MTYPLAADVTKTMSTNYGALGGYWDYDKNFELVFETEPIALEEYF